MNVTDWTEIDQPIFEIEGFIDAILDKTSILDILDRYEVEYSPCRTGEFSHRAKCPFPLHSFGEERTASFFTSEDHNKFYCFGCNSGGSVIDFVMLYEGKPFYEAAKLLAEHLGLTKENAGEALDGVVKSKRRNPEEKIMTHVFRAGVNIRNHLTKIKGKVDYKEWCDWADKRFVQLDRYLERLSDDDWEVAKDYHDKVTNYIKRKL